MTEPVGSKNVPKFKKWSKPLIGTGLCAMSSMIYTIANVLVKGVSVYKPHVVFVAIHKSLKQQLQYFKYSWITTQLTYGS